MISVKNLKRYYKEGEILVKALNGVSFNVEKGEFVAIMGPSGSGKTTMLRILGLIDQQTEGIYLIGKLNSMMLPEEERTFYRLTQLGYVFQDYALIDELTALGNVSLPMIMSGADKKESERVARKSLDNVGLEGKYNRVHGQLSGGEKQRVAVARSIVSSPKILFADEPCANLDSKTSEQVLQVFKKLNKKYGLTIIMVTHEKWHTKYVSRVINLKDGRITSDEKK